MNKNMKLDDKTHVKIAYNEEANTLIRNMNEPMFANKFKTMMTIVDY